jgi:hypothetical protein
MATTRPARTKAPTAKLTADSNAAVPALSSHRESVATARKTALLTSTIPSADSGPSENTSNALPITHNPENPNGLEAPVQVPALGNKRPASQPASEAEDDSHNEDEAPSSSKSKKKKHKKSDNGM